MRLRKGKTCRVHVAICGDNALIVDKTAREVLDFLRKYAHKVSGPVALPVRTGDLEIPGELPAGTGDVKGIAPGVSLLPVRSGREDGMHSWADLKEAGEYAADRAKVINFSLGVNSGVEVPAWFDTLAWKGVVAVSVLRAYSSFSILRTELPFGGERQSLRHLWGQRRFREHLWVRVKTPTRVLR